MNRAVKIVGGILNALGLVLIVLAAWHVYIDHRNVHAMAGWVYQMQQAQERQAQQQQRQQQQRVPPPVASPSTTPAAPEK